MRKNPTLNIWAKDWMPLTYAPNWIENIKLFFRKIKYSYQRIKYGYCDRDIWNLDNYYTNIIADTADQLADITCGYPGDDTPEGSSFEAWKEYLHTMAQLFRNSIEDYTYKNKYDEAIEKTFDKITWEDTPNGHHIMRDNLTPEEEAARELWFEECKRLSKLRENDLNTAMDMLKKRFWSMWD